MKEYIEFKKERDLGEILTGIFKFIRVEFKSLFGTVLKKAGPALLILVISYVFYIQSFDSLFEAQANNITGFSNTTFLALIVMLIAALVFYTLLYLTIISYVKSYVKNEGTVVKAEIDASIKENFWSVIGLSILVGLITGFGLVLCFIPGIYLGTVLIPAFSIHLIENRSVTDTINYCFELIKGEWWITFATLFVAGIIYYIIVIIGQIPQYIYFFARSFTIADTYSGDPNEFFDIGYTVLSSLGIIVQYLSQSFMVITSVFIYFNLNEKKNYTGTIETIDLLGSDKENE